MRYSRLITLFILIVGAIVGASSVFAQTSTKKPQRSSSNATASSKNNNEKEIRAVYEGWAKAFREHDVDKIMSFYATGDALVAYDIVPPLQYKGADSYRKDYIEFLAQYDGPIEVEFRDLHVIAGDTVAFIHALERISGTLKNGEKSDIWLRATSGLRKINGKWLTVHDHISVPTDFATGKAALDLKP